MARIQIEYTASVEAYKAKLQELIALNETLMRISNSANASIQNLNKSASQAGGTSKIASQANTAQKEAEKAQKAAEAAEKVKAKAAEAAEAAKIKAAEKAQKAAEALAKKSQKEAEAAEKAKVKATEAAENAKVRAAEAAAKKREAAEFRILLTQERKENAAVKATEAAENARVKAAEKEAKERDRIEKQAAKERERVEKQATRATEITEKQRIRAAQREAKERERLEKQAIRAAEMAEKQRVRATQQAEKERVRATQQAERERARASQERMRAEQNFARPLQGITSYVSAAFAIGSIVNFTKELVQLISQLEIVQSRFNFIYNGQEEGEKGFLRLSERIRTLGLDYQSTIEQFSSFSIAAQQANFTVLQTEDMFVRFASSLRAVGASNLQVQRSFYALQQMMSKGVVAAEELRRQMGESLPGAASLMYQAYKKLHPESVQTERDFMKLQEQGKILSREVLPEFINMLEKTFAPALESKINSLTATIERTEQAWLDFKFTLLDVQPIKNALNTITEKLRDFTNVSKARNLTAAEKDAYDRGVIGDVIIGAGVGATLLKLIPTLVNGFFTFLIQKAPQIGFDIAKGFTTALSTMRVSLPAFFLSLQGDTAEGSSPLGDRAKSRMDYEERRRIFAAEVEAKKRTQIENDLRKRYPELNGEAFAKRVQQALAIEMAKISSLKIGIDVKNLNTGLVQARGQVSARDLFSPAEIARLDYEARVAEAEKAASERQEASQRFRGLDQEGRESFIQTLTKELDFYGKKVEDIEQKFKDFPEKAAEEIKKLNERLRETGTLSANALNLPVGTRLTTGDFREMSQAYLADYLKIHQSLLETDLNREEEDKKALEARQKYLQGLVDLAKMAVEREKFELQKKGKDELGMETTNSKNLLELQKKLSKAELDLANHNDRESSQKLLANKQEYQLKVEKLDYEFSEYEKNVAYERGVRTINEQKAVLEKNLINLKEYQKESLQNTLDALDKEKELLKIAFEEEKILEQEYAKRLEEIDRKKFEARKKYDVAILDLELASVEKKISLVQQEFASFEMMTSDEMRLKEEAMRIEMEREIKQNELLGELAEARREKFNAEVKKMYADAAKEDREYFQDLKDYIEEPFLSSGEKEIRDIDKEVQDKITEYTRRVMAGRVRGAGAVEGFDPTTGLPQVSQGAVVTVGSKEFNDTVDKIRESGEKRKEGVTLNPFGLSDKQLSQIKDAFNIVGNAFKDLYDLRMELARRANEAELEMLEKRFNAGLMRENEYNEKVAEIKKRQALAERDAAKFGIVLNTAQGIANVWSKFGAVPPVAAALTALLLGVSAAQLNAVSSAPLPTFHEGGLDIRKNSKKKPDNGLKSDEFYAKLQEGESVMTREETKKHKSVLKDIRDGNYNPKYIDKTKVDGVKIIYHYTNLLKSIINNSTSSREVNNYKDILSSIIDNSTSSKEVNNYKDVLKSIIDNSTSSREVNNYKDVLKSIIDNSTTNKEVNNNNYKDVLKSIIDNSTSSKEVNNYKDVLKSIIDNSTTNKEVNNNNYKDVLKSIIDNSTSSKEVNNYKDVLKSIIDNSTTNKEVNNNNYKDVLKSIIDNSTSSKEVNNYKDVLKSIIDNSTTNKEVNNNNYKDVLKSIIDNSTSSKEVNNYKDVLKSIIDNSTTNKEVNNNNYKDVLKSIIDTSTSSKEVNNYKDVLKSIIDNSTTNKEVNNNNYKDVLKSIIDNSTSSKEVNNYKDVFKSIIDNSTSSKEVNNNNYKDVLKSIIDNSISSKEVNNYKDVLKIIKADSMPIELMKAYKLPAYPRSIDKPSLMDSNSNSLELAYQNAELVDAVKRNGAVTIRNANDIAEAIVSKSSFMKIANRRRIK